jgi:RNA recognition motif-containing protein
MIELTKNEISKDSILFFFTCSIIILYLNSVNIIQKNIKVERLRKEGSKLLEEEITFLNEELEKIKKTKKPQTLDPLLPRFKVTWLNKKFSTELTASLLEHLFSKYGQIEACLLNSKKTSAIVEFKILDDALNALKDEDNLKKKYSIILTWLGPDLNKTKIQNKEIPDPILIPETTNDEFSNLTFEEIEAAVLKKLKKN